MNSDILTTARRFTLDDVKTSSGVINAADHGALYPVQEVVAVSGNAQTRGFKVGDRVAINFDKFLQEVLREDPNSLKRDMDQVYKKQKVYSFPVYNVNGEEHLLLDCLDVLFIVEEHEEVDDRPSGNSGIITGTPIVTGTC